VVLEPGLSRLPGAFVHEEELAMGKKKLFPGKYFSD